MDEQEIALRKKVMEDFLGLSQHIPAELREQLDLTLTEEAKQHVLQLQLIAIQYGRALQRRDEGSRPRLVHADGASNLLRALMERSKK